MTRRALVFLHASIALTAYAQSEFYNPLTIQNDSNSTALRFERNVNTYLWNANALVRYDDDDLFIRFRENFFSSFVRGYNSSFRDEQNITLSMSKNISGPYAAAVEVQSFVVSDNQSLGSSTAGIHSGAAGIVIRPTEHFFFTPMVGVRYDKQQTFADNGMNYRIYTEADSLAFSGSRGGFAGQLNHSDVKNRQFNNNVISAYIATEFTSSSTNRMHVRWLNNRNDFYIPADSSVFNAFGVTSNIRSRDEQGWRLQDTLTYGIGSGFSTDLLLNIESRSILNAFKYQPLSVLSFIPFNTTVHETRFEGEVKLDYQSSSMLASVALQLGERNETHQLIAIDGIDEFYQSTRAQQESRLDNTALRNTLSAVILSPLSNSDDLAVSGSISLLQYDTPDTINTDDRDESLINVSVKESHVFNNVFSSSIVVEVTLAHLVYLSREKSANNNWNRIFRLRPILTYRPTESFRMFNSFEISANYTVFDFESLVPSVKSYSYRQVAFLDSTSYDISSTLGVDIVSFVRVSERGELHWQEFSERPLQRIEEVTFSPQLRFTFPQHWYFAVGFRSFAQKKFKYTNNIRQFESTFLSAGPTTTVVIQLSSMSLVEIRGWKEFQRQSGGSIQEYSNVTLNVRYYF